MATSTAIAAPDGRTTRGPAAGAGAGGPAGAAGGVGGPGPAVPERRCPLPRRGRSPAASRRSRREGPRERQSRGGGSRLLDRRRNGSTLVRGLFTVAADAVLLRVVPGRAFPHPGQLGGADLHPPSPLERLLHEALAEPFEVGLAGDPAGGEGETPEGGRGGRGS